jgi:hypothetical protein
MGLARFATEFRRNPPVAPMSFTFAFIRARGLLAQDLMLETGFIFA